MSVYLSYRSPEPSTHGFIIDYLSSEAILYVRSEKPVRYILHLMKLDVPNLFTGPPDDPGVLSGTSNPGEKFKEHLHSYIASNGLSRELLRNLDTIMVSLCKVNSQIVWCLNLCACPNFRVMYVPSLMVFKILFCLCCKRCVSDHTRSV